MFIEANKKRIDVSNAYASGQNQVSFEVTGIGADEATVILSKVSTFNLCEDDGNITEEYKHMAFVSAANIPEDDGTDTIVIVTFRKKTDIEIRVDALEASQSDQDDAIAEIAEMVAE